MSSADVKMRTIMEGLTCNIDRFWENKLLRKHTNEADLQRSIEKCLGMYSSSIAEQVLAEMKEIHIY